MWQEVSQNVARQPVVSSRSGMEATRHAGLTPLSEAIVYSRFY